MPGKDVIVLENVTIFGIILCFSRDVRIIKRKFPLRASINIRLSSRGCVASMLERTHVKED